MNKDNSECVKLKCNYVTYDEYTELNTIDIQMKKHGEWVTIESKKDIDDAFNFVKLLLKK